MDHCLRSVDYVNVIVAGKNQMPDWLDMDAAIAHCRAGVGAWDWASSPSVAAGGDARRGAGLLRRRADARDAGRRRPAAPAPARPGGAGGQRRRPHAAAARVRAPPRPVRRRVRRAVHHRPAGRVRLPRLPVADPPADLPAHEPPQHPRAGLQGGGHDDHAVRHGHAQRPRPLPPGDGRDRPGAGASGAAAADVRAEMVARRQEARDHTRAVGDDLPAVRDWAWPY